MQTPGTAAPGPIRLHHCSLRATLRAIRGIPFTCFPLALPSVHPLAAPFILRQLKRNGFSNCRVTSGNTGLLVFAEH